MERFEPTTGVNVIVINDEELDLIKEVGYLYASLSDGSRIIFCKEVKKNKKSTN